MSPWPILAVALEREADVVAVRQRARRIAELLGFEVQDQTRIATAVSEIARNAVTYAGGGRTEFALDGAEASQRLVVRVSDKGPGIVDLDLILGGAFRSPTGLGLGIVGARRLMDGFGVESAPGRGTVVTLDKALPRGRPVTRPMLLDLARRLAAEAAGDPLAELRAQNRELLRGLGELKAQQEEAARLNEELDHTNKGVVALYAELDRRAIELQSLNATLEERVATAIAEREAAEASLRQAQKMEAVGQLTGGIAHDFNNLLAVIVGSLDLMQRRLDQGRTEALGRYLSAAMTSAQRAAALTHRLLAFSRRQPLDPRPVDANELVVAMEDMLRRTIGPAHALELGTSEGLWTTLCDPHQLEGAILNLAINARDAMPDGGRLTIGTANARLDGGEADAGGAAPGQYVAITVADTGTGMPPEVIARAFEPFFTTKPLGRGTGLGLSMVYGFARQSEGHAAIRSEVGLGTRVTIHLPRYRGAAEPEPPAAPAAAGAARSGAGQTVLVVEDEAAIRALIVEVLHELGCRALEAGDGPAGLAVLEAPGRIDLLVTDVGLPGLNGRQLADQARETRPDLKVLFVTGYAETAMLSGEVLEPGMAMLTKPFAVEGLTGKITAMLRAGS